MSDESIILNWPRRYDLLTFLAARGRDERLATDARRVLKSPGRLFVCDIHQSGAEDSRWSLHARHGRAPRFDLASQEPMFNRLGFEVAERGNVAFRLFRRGAAPILPGLPHQ